MIEVKVHGTRTVRLAHGPCAYHRENNEATHGVRIKKKQAAEPCAQPSSCQTRITHGPCVGRTDRAPHAEESDVAGNMCYNAQNLGQTCPPPRSLCHTYIYMPRAPGIGIERT